MNIWKKISFNKIQKPEYNKKFGFNSTIWLKKIKRRKLTQRTGSSKRVKKGKKGIKTKQSK